VNGAAGGGSSPLAGLRVIAVEQYGAGPWATVQLADLGAEVIKIEDPNVKGDVGRYVPPFQEGEDSLFFETFNHNKKSISLDLHHPDGRRVIEDLARVSDVMFCNLRGDLPAKLGLDYGHLKNVNPAIVCCSLSGFGKTGPRASEPAYDYVIQGLTGWMSLAGEPDGPPQRTGLPLVDLSAGYVAAIAILAALRSVAASGLGCDCDISLYETALHQLSYIGTWAASRRHSTPRLSASAHPSMVPFQMFATGDGWIVVACPKQVLYERLCEAIGRPGLADDPRFADFRQRFENREILISEIAAVMSRRTTDEWVDILRGSGIPHAPVNDVLSALDDPQIAARESIAEYAHDELGTVLQLQSPIRITGMRVEPQRAPRRGENTLDILEELLGYQRDRIVELHASGAFGEIALDLATQVG
jgi:crotonobetainyl-CoA:carnitine CoA-transferase CaiB-like acyl-CoA transferase